MALGREIQLLLGNESTVERLTQMIHEERERL